MDLARLFSRPKRSSYLFFSDFSCLPCCEKSCVFKEHLTRLIIDHFLLGRLSTLDVFHQ